MKFTLSEEEHSSLMRLAEERGEPAAVLLREMIRERFAATGTKRVLAPTGAKKTRKK
jgi:hypothetical protein